RMLDMGLNRSQLAGLLGVSSARVTNILRGNTNFTMRSLVEIANALGCDLGVSMNPRVAGAQGTNADTRNGQPFVAAEGKAAYRTAGSATYRSRDPEIRDHLRSGKLKVEDGVVYMRRERDGLYYPATLRKTNGDRTRLRTNVGRRAYFEHRIIAVAQEMGQA
ncbi:MAG: helix-turn-helix domain-containing protein, partial [Actinobacteria bacterium]|nr:helix-turn-helix domain-containing protein [Actinomycetota bacterium]MCG2808632.1 helix-turn-helix domain-containing protein [Coriobacteriia bacterium]